MQYNIIITLPETKIVFPTIIHIYEREFFFKRWCTDVCTLFALNLYNKVLGIKALARDPSPSLEDRTEVGHDW